jgi:hypothetical protein
MALEALSSHICIEAVSHELVDKAANIGFILFASALKIVKITKALTMLVAESPTTPERGRISVMIYKAIVTGTRPRGFSNAASISSSTFDSVLDANLPIALRTVAIIKPLNRNAASKIISEIIISDRLTP